MSIWSHILLNSIIFGPSPTVALGSLVVDTFDYANWIRNFSNKKVSFKLFRKDPQTFDRLTDQGVIWGIHQILNYSVITLVVTTVLAVYFYGSGRTSLFLFCASFLTHMVTDYFTHQYFYPLFPSKKVKCKFCLPFYKQNSFKTIFSIDFILLVILLFRLTQH